VSTTTLILSIIAAAAIGFASAYYWPAPEMPMARPEPSSGACGVGR